MDETSTPKTKVPKERIASREESVPIRVIKSLGKAVVVSYVKNQTEHRVILPASSVTGDTLAESLLLSGIPYGIQWGKLDITITASLAAVEKELHNADVWTIEDFMSKPQAVNGAIKAALSLDYVALLTAATKSK